MAGIIIFLILAVGYAMCGDTSGLGAIGKVILCIALFIGVGCIIVYAPWLILIVIVGIVFWAIISSKENKGDSSNNTNYSSSNNYNNYQHQSEENEKPFINNSNQTDFQRQLQQNTKTPQEVEDENWLKEKEQITNEANRDYTDLKQKLLDKARKGQYSTTNGQKCITLEYYCPYLLSCVDRKYYRNPTGKIGTSSYRTNEKVYYHINKIKQYDLYLSKVMKLAKEDNISILPFWVEVDMVYKTERNITLPYTFSKDWYTSRHSIKPYLRCSITY